ncbi:flavonol sulfotransferase-like [Ricinus communis]|uniref:flavonol sulfotransferase-like n=1 Tax=Ricinus communis TaxID=3988 RepID=UPI00201B280C|nr:flavonol sulfotransferase-like [Ricinus communis]
MESSFYLVKNDEEKTDTHNSEYREIMSTLPKAKDYSNYGQDLYQYQGFWYIIPFLEGVLSAQNNFMARSNDIIVASFMKTGTTWLKALAFAIVTRASFDLDSANPLLKKVPHDCIPFLEYDLAKDSSNRDLTNPLVSTHMPYTSLPKSIVDCGCKIIYIWRDPKDVFISMWFFLAKVLMPMGVKPDPLEEAFEMFCKGFTYLGPYWDHILGYWEAKQKFPEKMLFLKYEEMKKDTSSYVKKLAEFMGYPFSLEEEEEGVLEHIINLCSFENLSNLEVNKTGKHRENTSKAMDNQVFFRKGKTGDWENHLTPEMGARLDEIMRQKLTGSGLANY